jgi:hypothetical protein
MPLSFWSSFRTSRPGWHIFHILPGAMSTEPGEAQPQGAGVQPSVAGQTFTAVSAGKEGRWRNVLVLRSSNRS